MTIIFKSNLDQAQLYIAGLNDDISNNKSLDVPPKGTRFRFTLDQPLSRVFDLEVVDVTYDVDRATYFVELHIPPAYSWSVQRWEEHMRKLKRL